MDVSAGRIDQRCRTRGKGAKESVQGTRCTSFVCEANRNKTKENYPERVDNNVSMRLYPW